MSLLPESLKTLGLHHTAAQLDDLVALATKRRFSPTQLLEHLAEAELQERTRRSLERRLARAKIGRFTPMSEFDWAWPTHVDRPAIDAALHLDFLAQSQNLILVAAQGLGQTMIAQNVAYQAVLAGHHVLFTTASQLLLDLGAQESARGLARRLQHYSQPALLVVDEVGYIPTPAPPICSSRSSAGATRKRASPSPPTCPSPTGRPCFPTPRPPSPSSIASCTTRRSSRSKAPAIADAPPRSSTRPARPLRREPAPFGPRPTACRLSAEPAGQIPADLHGRQHLSTRHRPRARAAPANGQAAPGILMTFLERLAAMTPSGPLAAFTPPSPARSAAANRGAPRAPRGAQRRGLRGAPRALRAAAAAAGSWPFTPGGRGCAISWTAWGSARRGASRRPRVSSDRGAARCLKPPRSDAGRRAHAPSLPASARAADRSLDDDALLTGVGLFTAGEPAPTSPTRSRGSVRRAPSSRGGTLQGTEVRVGPQPRMP